MSDGNSRAREIQILLDSSTFVRLYRLIRPQKKKSGIISQNWYVFMALSS